MQQFVDTRDFLSQTKFYEGYSRYKEDEGRYETWDEAVDRVIDMHEQNYITNNNRLQPFVEEARTAYYVVQVQGSLYKNIILRNYQKFKIELNKRKAI